MTPRTKLDLLRVFVLLVCSGVFLYASDPANAVIFQAFGIAVFMVGGTHLTRRILFNRVDLQDVANEAWKNNNVGAAVVFASICVFLISIMYLAMQVIR